MNPAAVCRKAAAMLSELEWASDWYGDSCCPRCGAMRDLDLPSTDRYPHEPAGAHRPICDLRAMICELKAVEGTAAKVQRKENE